MPTVTPEQGSANNVISLVIEKEGSVTGGDLERVTNLSAASAEQLAIVVKDGKVTADEIASLERFSRLRANNDTKQLVSIARLVGNRPEALIETARKIKHPRSVIRCPERPFWEEKRPCIVTYEGYLPVELEMVQGAYDRLEHMQSDNVDIFPALKLIFQDSKFYASAPIEFLNTSKIDLSRLTKDQQAFLANSILDFAQRQLRVHIDAGRPHDAEISGTEQAALQVLGRLGEAGQSALATYYRHNCANAKSTSAKIEDRSEIRTVVADILSWVRRMIGRFL